MRHMVDLLVVLGLAACWAGCGGGDYSSPKATYQTMQNAAKAGNREGVIGCLDWRTRKALPKAKENMIHGDPVADIMALATKAKVEIGPETITGQTATLLVAIDGNTHYLPFLLEDKEWKFVWTHDMWGTPRPMRSPASTSAP